MGETAAVGERLGCAGVTRCGAAGKAGEGGAIVAALSVIVTEAGGMFTNLNGETPDLEIRSVLAANPSLHEKYLSQLRGHVP